MEITCLFPLQSISDAVSVAPFDCTNSKYLCSIFQILNCSSSIITQKLGMHLLEMLWENSSFRHWVELDDILAPTILWFSFTLFRGDVKLTRPDFIPKSKPNVMVTGWTWNQGHLGLNPTSDHKGSIAHVQPNFSHGVVVKIFLKKLNTMYAILKFLEGRTELKCTCMNLYVNVLPYFCLIH